jgi:glycosyltransferase involved in cell wall biosynthesis
MSRAARILFVQYTNPAGYPPLEHASRLLAGAGWQVCFLGTGAFGSERLRFPAQPNIRVLTMPRCGPGWRQKWHYARYLVWVLTWVGRWHPRWIYASDLLACPVALLLSYLPGCRVIYHEHDSPQEAGTSLFLRWCQAARRQLARRAAVCVLPSTVRARNFAAQTGARKVCCVWNCPTTDELGPSRVNGEGAETWLLYHGSITPPQLPPTVLDALARLPACVKLRVIGYETIGHPNYVRQLRERSEQLGVAGRVEFLGSLPTRHELLRWCGQSDLGLALFAKQGLQPMSGASNKPFDYLTHGCALLVSDLPDWRSMYVEPGYGLACDPDDPQSIAAAIRWLLDNPARRRAMGEQGRRRILQEWNYETQFAPVLELLQGRRQRLVPMCGGAS